MTLWKFVRTSTKYKLDNNNDLDIEDANGSLPPQFDNGNNNNNNNGGGMRARDAYVSSNRCVFFCLILLFFSNFLFYSPFYYHHDKRSPYEDIHATSTTCTTYNDADNHTNAGRMTRAEEGDDWG